MAHASDLIRLGNASFLLLDMSIILRLKGVAFNCIIMQTMVLNFEK